MLETSEMACVHMQTDQALWIPMGWYPLLLSMNKTSYPVYLPLLATTVPDSTSKEIVKLITEHVSSYINKKKGAKPWSTVAGPFDTWVEELGIARVVPLAAVDKVEPEQKEVGTEEQGD